MTRTFLPLLVLPLLVAACGSDEPASSDGASGDAPDDGSSDDGSSGTGGIEDPSATSGPTSTGSNGSSSGGAGTGGSGTGGSSRTGGNPPKGACPNAADQAILGMINVEEVVGQCAQENFGAEPGTKECIKDSTQLSDPCVTCFDNTVQCTVQNCLGQCAGGQTPECTACMEANCLPDFQAC